MFCAIRMFGSSLWLLAFYLCNVRLYSWLVLSDDKRVFVREYLRFNFGFSLVHRCNIYISSLMVGLFYFCGREGTFELRRSQDLCARLIKTAWPMLRLGVMVYIYMVLKCHTLMQADDGNYIFRLATKMLIMQHLFPIFDPHFIIINFFFEINVWVFLTIIITFQIVRYIRIINCAFVKII